MMRMASQWNRWRKWTKHTERKIFRFQEFRRNTWWRRRKWDTLYFTQTVFAVLPFYMSRYPGKDVLKTSNSRRIIAFLREPVLSRKAANC